MGFPRSNGQLPPGAERRRRHREPFVPPRAWPAGRRGSGGWTGCGGVRALRWAWSPAGSWPHPPTAPVRAPPRPPARASGVSGPRGRVRLRDPGSAAGGRGCSGPPWPPGALWPRLARGGRRSPGEEGEGRRGEEREREGGDGGEGGERRRGSWRRPSRAGSAGRAGRSGRRRGRRRSRGVLAGGRVAAAAAWRSRAGPRRGPPFGSPSRPPRTRRRL